MSSNENIISGFDDLYDKTLSLILDEVPNADRCISVFVKGSIDNYNSSFFQEKLDKIFASGYINIIFRCSTLEYVSSTGIGVFAAFFSKLKEVGGNIVFTDLQSKVEELFQLLGFSHFFHIVSSHEEAVTFFNTESSTLVNIFPKVVDCPLCNAHLKAKHSGKFRCPSCKAIISVDEQGTVSI